MLSAALEEQYPYFPAPDKFVIEPRPEEIFTIFFWSPTLILSRNAPQLGGRDGVDAEQLCPKIEVIIADIRIVFFHTRHGHSHQRCPHC